MNDIIRGMFHNQGNFRSRTKPEDPKNWRTAQNIVWGGINHQHPHCDQGKAGCFHNEAVFPFVCIHGFGVHEFVLWLLLPARKKREYGFPYRFSKKSIYSVYARRHDSCWWLVVCSQVVHTWSFTHSRVQDGNAVKIHIGPRLKDSNNGKKRKITLWFQISEPFLLPSPSLGLKARMGTRR